MITSHGKDVIVLSGRKFQVDLSYLGSPETIERTKVILEKVIGVYSQIPGKIDSKKVAEKGVFEFNVSNKYLSPDSDSSEPQTEYKSLAPRQALPKKNLPPFILGELVDGIPLEPRFPGIPPYIMKYGSGGISEGGVAALRGANPEASTSELVKQILIHTGQYRKILNLYKLPK